MRTASVYRYTFWSMAEGRLASAVETIHITDKYFFEEFRKSLGKDGCHEWLRILSNGAGLARRSSSGSTVTSTSSSSLCSLPPSSAFPTPQSRPKTPNQESICSLCLLSPLNTDRIDHTKGELQSENAPEVIRSLKNMTIGSGNEVYIEDLSFFLDGRTSSLPCFSKIGLLYTDAAHSVLQDQEVAEFITRSQSAIT